MNKMQAKDSSSALDNVLFELVDDYNEYSRLIEKQKITFFASERLQSLDCNMNDVLSLIFNIFSYSFICTFTNSTNKITSCP